MLNEKKLMCLYPNCSNVATRVLTYFVDLPTIYSNDPKQEVFCDEHAQAEMLDLQKPGFLKQSGWDGTKVDCIVNQLTNEPLEDGCNHKLTKYDSLAEKAAAETKLCEEL